MSMGRRDNRPYCAAYELACMICEQSNPDYPNECQAPVPCHFYLAFSSQQLPLLWIFILVSYIWSYIIVYCFFYPSKYAYIPNKVVRKVTRLGVANGQFGHHRASNA
jgi:hypothetical protein